MHQAELETQIEELKKSKVALEESRNRYIEFYDFAPVGYLTLIETGQISEINFTGAALLGVEREKILRRHLSGFVAPEDRNCWQRHFMDTLSRDSKLTCELNFRSGEGKNIHVQLDSRRQITDGNVPLVRIVLTDISKSKQFENALREQEVFFGMIAENTDDYIAVLDLKGRRLYNSPSYAKLFGNVASLIGTDSFAEIHPADRKNIQQVFMETVQTGVGMHADFRFLLADGSIRHMESRGTLLRNSNGVALRVVVVSRDITERKQAAEEINSLALYDALTGMSNRRLLNDRLAHVMTSSKRSGCNCALLFIDLDNFKPLNDKHGHAAGDSLLVEVSSRISDCVREVDSVSRFGGDEFVVLLSELSTDKDKSTKEAGIVAEKIRISLAEPYTLTVRQEGKADANLQHSCTASIGVYLFKNSDSSAEEIIKRADMAMYQAKIRGRNSIGFY
jgi:diguanylate cyclase (GGDEF)-like protein/PAS domain S-box-containing protein